MCCSRGKTPLLSPTKVLGVTGRITACDHIKAPLVLTSSLFEQLEVWEGKSYLSPHLEISLKLKMGFERPASNGLILGRRNKSQQDPSELHGFSTHPSPVLSRHCPLYELFLFSWTPQILIPHEHLQVRHFSSWMLIISGLFVSSVHPFVALPTALKLRCYSQPNTEGATPVLRSHGRSSN